MMKILDRYLIKQFIQTLLFGLVAFAAIFLIIDLMENLDDFIDQNVSNRIIVEYYISFLPEIVRLMTPVAALLACLFTVGKMANQNELAAIKSSGVSLYRFMAPFVAAALLVSFISILFGGYVVPLANKNKVSIEVNYMRKNVVYAGSNIYFQDKKNRIVGISFFDVNTSQANKVTIQEFNNADLTQMIKRYDAFKMAYDTAQKVWILSSVRIRTFDNIHGGEKVEFFLSYNFKDLSFLPKEVVTKQQKVEEMNLTELSDFIDNQKRAGNDPTRAQIEYYSRFSFGFASLVCVLFGLPISSNKRRGGLALQFGINLLITFIYLGFMKISQAFGKNGVMDPILTAWFANILFLIAAIFSILKTQK
ncbi:MAG TPA: LptF/LptG family permease [Ignavibacteriales bacterium]|nr:LptF/LptG family permease [Ignavibacteriales bacterium]